MCPNGLSHSVQEPMEFRVGPDGSIKLEDHITKYRNIS
jgi:hypothetical protein